MSVSRALLLEGFSSIFGEFDSEEIGTYFSPGSLIFCGEHNGTNGGMVLPCALTLGNYAAIRKRDDAIVRVYSDLCPEDGILEFNVIEQFPVTGKHEWFNYPQSAVWTLRAHGHHLPSGFDIFYHNDIPTDAGLGSSASLLSLTVYAIAKTFGFSVLSRRDIALMCKDAKSNFLEIPAGTLASYASLMGKKDNAIFYVASGLHLNYAPLPLTLSKARIVIANSNKTYDQNEMNKLLAKRYDECAQAYRYFSNVVYIKSLCGMPPYQFETYKDIIPYPDIVKRARHIVYENERTYQAFTALQVKNLSRFGKVLNESYLSLRDNFETSCPEVDTLVEIALGCPGVIASRMTGVGLGGCTLNIVMEENIDEFIKTVGETYKEKTGIEASFFIADIGDGTRQIKE